MKKCYKFIIDKWTDPATAADYRRVVRSWIKEDGVDGKASLWLKDDVKIYATDKDVIHMVLTDGERWADLPPILSNFGSDILDLLIDFINDRDCDDDDDECDDYDAEEELYDYLTD